MINLSTATKKHYLIKTMTGFENIFRTRITSIESYSNDPDTLYIYMYVNPTMDQYTDVQRVETTVKYNLVKDSFTIKLEGKGAKKYNKQIKHDVTGIIEGLTNESYKYYTGDQAESLFLTQQYFYNQLKEEGAETALLNQFHYDTNHTYNTVEEMETAVNEILISLKVNNQIKDNENMLTNNEKEVIALRLGIDQSLLNNTVFTAEELKNADFLRFIGEHANNTTFNILKERNENDFSFYFTNVITGILDGTHTDIITNIYNEYNEHKEKVNKRIMLEKSFDLPDHEITLQVFIERSSMAENVLKTKHENIIKEALTKGLNIPSEVMADYPHLINTNEKEETNTIYTVGSRSFNSYNSALQYCNESDFDPELMIIKEAVTMQPSQDIPEEFYLYKNTFTTYSDAYNYALKYQIPVTMIISNKHPYMTSQRLQELEKEYVFSKGNMTYTDMQEYFKYISDEPITLDREDRYYKLRSYIQRYEYKEQQKEQREKEQKEKAYAIDQMLKELYSIGMTKKETKNYVQYYLNNEQIYSWFGGITIEKMYDELIQVHDKHYKRLQAV